MPQFRATRAARIASTSGFIAVVEAGEVFEVPEAAVPDALAVGCLPSSAPASATPEQLPTDDEKLEELKRIITALVAKNDPKDFNADGSPRVYAVRKSCSFPATGDEVRTAFEAFSLGV